MGNYIDECRARGLNPDQMNEVILGLKHHLTTTQVDLYAQEKYDFMQMQEIRLGLENGLSEKQMSVFLDSSIDYKAMRINRMQLEDVNAVNEHASVDLIKKQVGIGFRILLILAVLFFLLVGSYFGKKYFDIWNQPMQINLKTDRIELNYGETFDPIQYIENYTKADGIQLILPSHVNTRRIGQTKVIYTVKNLLKSVSKELIITIRDKTPPVIKLNKKDVTLIRKKDTFKGKAYLTSAIDEVDGDITESVTWTVANESKDDQIITYHVKDKAGNATKEMLSLHYKDPISEPKPEISTSSTTNKKPEGSSQNNSGGVSPPAKSQSHGTRYFMFSDGYNLDSGYKACVATGKKIGTYSCEPIMGKDGIYKGYKLTY